MLRVLSLHLLPIGVLLSLGVAACGSHPEANSGGDAYRHQAQAMPLDEWVAGDLDAGEGDRTDWKAVDIEVPGKLVVDFHADDKGVAVDVAVFDRYGYSLGSVTRPKGADGPVQVTVAAKREGRYFVMIQQKAGGLTSYSVRATREGGGRVPVPDF